MYYCSNLKGTWGERMERSKRKRKKEIRDEDMGKKSFPIKFQ
jgi:hypothetical protein